jgi:hypothetical protein
MSTGRELSSDAQDASRFAPKWARDPQQNGSARRPTRPHGDIWLGDADEAARDDFRSGEGGNEFGLFRPPLEPTVIPDPRSASRGRSKAGLFVGLGLGLGFAAAGLAVATFVFGVIARDSGSAGQSAPRLAPVRLAPAASAAVADEDRPRASTGHLAVSMPTSPFPSQEAAPLGVAIYGTGPRGNVVIGGFAPGSTVSSGQALGPDTWVLSPSQIDGAVITPPSGFAGAMDLLFELRLADGRVVDRKHARLEWSAPPPVAAANVPPAAPRAMPAAGASAAGPVPAVATDASSRTLGSEEIIALLKRGNELVAHGDLVGARLFFERAAQAGESRAALALASTYDPLVLEQMGERGLAPDVALARFWYERAKELGSKEAPERLEVLVSRSN